MEHLLTNEINNLCNNYSDLKLLIVFGSQARGEANQRSDWDFGYISEKKNYKIAQTGPNDLHAFLATVAKLL